jgi:hypothetical protein
MLSRRTSSASRDLITCLSSDRRRFGACLVLDCGLGPKLRLWGGQDIKRPNELPGPTTPGNGLPRYERFPYCLTAEQYE